MGTMNPEGKGRATSTLDVQAPTDTARPGELHNTQYDMAPWSGDNVSRRPICWPRSKKWIATLILSAIAFIQALAETTLAPVEDQLSQALEIEHAYEWMLVNSLVLIGIGLSSLLLAPLSEVYGRKPILVLGSISFVIWNTGCGVVQTLDQMLALRVFSGFGASVGDTVAGGVLSDLWEPEARGRAFAIFMAPALLGTAIGPICGAYISEGLNWRWVFWISSIASALIIAIAIFFLRETYEPAIQKSLIRKARRVNGADTVCLSKSSSSHGTAGFVETMRINLQRPFRMLGTQIIVQILAVYMACLYGIMWLFLFMYPRMWRDQYQQDIGPASLNYLSFGIGLLAGVNLAGYLNDRIYARLKSRNNGVGRPEYRIPVMSIGTVFTVAGLLLWGWAGEFKLHWIVPNIGTFVFATGVYVCSACVSVYTIDTYTKYAASAISTNLVLRSLCAAFYPLFAPYMFDSLGFGFSATTLAAAFGVFGVASVTVLWFFGESLRARSPYCAADLDNTSDDSL